ncbi:BamA/TamA family outer membrane protein [Isosphaeraceae bacterium EP7]
MGLLVAFALLALGAGPKPLPEGTITEVVIEGNDTVPAADIKAKLQSRAGRPLDQKTIDVDMKNLFAMKKFSDVLPYYDPDPDGKGYKLIYKVTEMTMLTSVEFRGRKKVKLSDLEEATELKKGSRADTMRARLAVNQITRVYQDKGYELARVQLLEGGKEGDTKVVFEIYEGPYYHVGNVTFKGNTFVSDATLATKVGSRAAILGLIGGKYHKESLDEDRRKLVEYYQANGFLEVKVSPVTRTGSDLGDLRIEFVISEGVQYKVRDLKFEGNKKIPSEDLKVGLNLHSGQPFNDSVREADRKKILTKYYELGCIDTQINPEPKYTDQPGVIDLVYAIDEGEVYYLADFLVRGNQSTRDKVIRREAIMAGVLPGETLNLNRLETYRTRLQNLNYFQTDPQLGKALDIKIVNRRPNDKPYGDLPVFDIGQAPKERMQDSPVEVTRTRMQSPDPAQDPIPALEPGPPPSLDEPLEVPAATAEPQPGQGVGLPFGAGADFQPPPDTPPMTVVPPPGGGRRMDPRPIAPQVVSPEGPPPSSPDGFPELPGGNMTDVGPDRQEPFSNRSYADIVTQVDEAPTGRLLFGVGATSYGGLSGNLILHERNFDIFNAPRSFGDLTSGRAFRGAGQEFRVELSPGTQINRFVVSFRDPYLFDQPLGFGSSGYIFQRIYKDWTEGRAGGRFSLGYQFSPQAYADMAFRIEDVNLYGYKSPAPADLLAAAGHTTLATLRPSLRIDNRNNPFLPTKGQYLELAYEQLWGTFTAPKFTAEGRQHWQTGSRPDGSGKRTLTARGFFGITGRDTPIYERFFAGDFRSMRGFAYRGVGPHQLGVNVGGVMTAVGSLEYQFPWTASDTLQQVIFCDFGTVEADYSFTNFRAAVGTGIRVSIPALGPLPLAFDLAFPVAKDPGDQTKYFTFFIGAFW